MSAVLQEQTGDRKGGSEMIDRVAQALEQKLDGTWIDMSRGPRLDVIELARAAIEALRVPTDRMALVDTDPEGATLIWQRMIDEALR